MNTAIINGRIVDPAGGTVRDGGVFISGDAIAGIGAAPAGFTAERTIDASGLTICPGLIDMCARTREPGLERKATIASETAAAAAGGITALCCPPDTVPAIDTPAMAHLVRQRGREAGASRVLPVGALTTGLAGKTITDMAALADSGCVAIGNALAPVVNSLVMRRALQYAATFNLAVILHAEDPWLRGNGCVHEGEVSTRLGLAAIPATAETVGVARDLALIEQTRARAHFGHLSCGRAVAMVAEAQRNGLPVTAGVTAHHLHLCEEDVGEFDSRCHVIPPLRSRADRRALREAVQSGVLSAVCSDHQPHGADAKLVPFGESEPGISGLETLLPLVLRLAGEGVADLPAALALVTSGPAKILGLNAGALAPGAPADVCIFDAQKEWTLDAAKMHSRGRNTPFDGQPMRGKVALTLVGGKVAYRDPAFGAA